jgi:hypothetical protein
MVEARQAYACSRSADRAGSAKRQMRARGR